VNRKQRRMLANNPVALNAYTKTVEKKTVEKATTESLRLVAYTMSLALHDMYGFGGKRLNKLLDKATRQIECIAKGYVKLDEIIEEVKKLGVKVE
jgi:phage-related minor tail protein